MRVGRAVAGVGVATRATEIFSKRELDFSQVLGKRFLLTRAGVALFVLT